MADGYRDSEQSSGRALTRKKELLRDLDRKTVSSARSSGPISRSRASTQGRVLLVIDCSTSMLGSNIDQAKSGALQFAVRAYGKGYSVGLISFASQATLVMVPNTDRGKLERAVGRLDVDGSTNMSAALSIAKSQFQRRVVGPRAVVVVTDGFPDDRTGACAEARVLREMGVRVITIGTDDADVAFLNRLSSHKDLAKYVQADKLSLAMKSASGLLPRTTRGQLGPSGTE